MYGFVNQKLKLKKRKLKKELKFQVYHLKKNIKKSKKNKKNVIALWYVRFYVDLLKNFMILRMIWTFIKSDSVSEENITHG